MNLFSDGKEIVRDIRLDEQERILLLAALKHLHHSQWLLSHYRWARRILNLIGKINGSMMINDSFVSGTGDTDLENLRLRGANRLGQHARTDLKKNRRFK